MSCFDLGMSYPSQKMVNRENNGRLTRRVCEERKSEMNEERRRGEGLVAGERESANEGYKSKK